MSTHKVEDYKDADGQWRWRVVVEGTQDSAVEDNIVADSGQGYSNKQDMLKSFFGIYFGEYDDSFLALYNEWNPDKSQVEYNEPPPQDESVSVPEGADDSRES